MSKAVQILYGLRFVTDGEGNPLPNLTNSGGNLIQRNFLEIASRSGPSVVADEPPTAYNDSLDTAGVGVAFTRWSQWLDRSTGTLYVCEDAGTAGGDAVWRGAGGSGYQSISEKNQAGGYAGLGDDGMLPADLLPDGGDIDGGTD